jgi:acetyl esterase/lipase
MLRNTLAAFAVLALVGAPATAQPARKPLPIEALERHPAYSGPALSPDGKHIAALIGVDGQRWPVVAIWKTDALDKTPVGIPSRDMRPRGVGFRSNTEISFAVDQPFTYGSCKAFAINNVTSDLEGKKLEPSRQLETLLKRVRDLGSGLGCGINFGAADATLVGDVFRTGKILIQSFDAEDLISKIYEYDINTKRSRLVAVPPENRQFTVADPRTMQLVVREGVEVINGVNTFITEIRNPETGAWERHDWFSFPVRERRTRNAAAVAPDPNKLVVASDHESDNVRLYEYDIRTRTISKEPIFAHPRFDATNAFWALDRANKKITGYAGFEFAGPDIEQVWVDPEMAKLYDQLRRTFPGRNVSIGGDAENGFRIVVVDGPRHPPIYLLYRPGQKLFQLGSNRPWIDPNTLGESSWVIYKARDGKEIPAILTLPPGWKKGDPAVPAVVLPHGGPWSRDFLGWDGSGWPQFLATRGYAVLQPQYRGSSGLGRALWVAGDAEWGQKMQDDKDDGAFWMVEQGIARKDKMAMFGYSYGGFAAVAAAVRPNSPYQCAIAGAPVSSLERLANFWGSNRIARQVQGWTVAGMDPYENVDKQNIPLILYHGDRDRQADTDHSTMYYSRAKGMGKDVEYVEVKDMWHQLPWWPEWHRQTLGLIEQRLAGPKCFGKGGA